MVVLESLVLIGLFMFPHLVICPSINTPLMFAVFTILVSNIAVARVSGHLSWICQGLWQQQYLMPWDWD